MILKCNHCKQNLVVFGEVAPGLIVDCHICRKGLGLAPGRRSARPRWWRPRRGEDEPLVPADSRLPFRDLRAYSLEGAVAEMTARPGTLWSPAGRIRYGMCCAYTYNGEKFIVVGHDDKPGNGSGPEAKLPFEATVQDWYELEPQKFYTIFFHWEDRWSNKETTGSASS